MRTNAVLRYPEAANPTSITATRVATQSQRARSSSILQGGCVMPRGFLFLLIISVSAVFAFAQGSTTRPRASATPVLKGETPNSTSAKKPSLSSSAQKVTPQSTTAPTVESNVVFVAANLIQTPVSVLDRKGRSFPNMKM